MRIVIVGATGNIGTAILRRLSAGDPSADLVGISRHRPDQTVEPYRDVEWHQLDISATDAVQRLTEAIAGADAVVHLAWLLQPNHREHVLWATNVVGTRNVLTAVAAAGVPHLVVASSVGAYSRGPKHHRVDESWPTGGVHTSHYARQKAVVERQLDAFETAHPGVVVSRVRPGLVFQRSAAHEIVDLFIGPLVPTRWLGQVRLPILTVPAQVISQAVHADDLADAFARILERRAGGAFNIADEPVLDPAALGRVLGARVVLPIRRTVVRALMWATWKLRLQRADPGWLDIATNVPVMSTERARVLLGWEPQHTSTAALRELLDGIADDARAPASPRLSR
ncbi:NAD-dependent epimerase/dehydratase family protein [Glaciibacter flavus]|uniref:NAD-dependent epimerase/dehydratase family protein n=1 Tax=Orlajensenia flava TaxID=2565934 RepID=A0A4S4FPZ6_9MICO|nr:NAD-dependent epimerase/dehydratase family protein [Glaciibacter flavus]THG32663.1 NAD-dependent epimerase/dehydratase family protein [Glaciibacter flavus]